MDYTKEIEKAERELEKVEHELDKCRASTLEDGWQTQKFAKKSRKWDYWAQKKNELRAKIDDLKYLHNKAVFERLDELTQDIKKQLGQ